MQVHAYQHRNHQRELHDAFPLSFIQVDLAREASNLQRFNFNFRHTSHVQFPVPLYPLVSSEVLVETFEEGDHITSYITSRDNPHNHSLAILGSGTMLQVCAEVAADTVRG